MKGMMVVVRVRGGFEVKALDAPPTLEELQGAVGGYIQRIPMFISVQVDPDTPGAIGPEMAPNNRWQHCVVYANEEGKLRNLPVNPRATAMWQSLWAPGVISDFLVGPVCIIYGDRQLMKAMGWTGR